MRLIIHLRQQDLPALNAIHFYLALLAILEVECCEAFQFVFLRHGSGGGAESGAAAGSSEEGAVEEVDSEEQVDTVIRDGKVWGHEIEG